MHFDPDDAGVNLSSVSGFKGWLAWRKIRRLGEFGFIRSTVRRRQRVLDIGANIGLYTLQFAKLVGPSGSVIAFEPGRKSFDLLTRNIQENGYVNVRLEKAAILDRSGETDFFLCPTGESDNRAPGAIAADSGWERISVPCFALDDYVKGQSVDFIKMDIQGSELPALLGMRQTIIRNSAIKILMEYTPDLMDADGFFRFTSELGLSTTDVEGKPLSEAHLRSLRGAHVNIVLAH